MTKLVFSLFSHQLLSLALPYFSKVYILVFCVFLFLLLNTLCFCYLIFHFQEYVICLLAVWYRRQPRYLLYLSLHPLSSPCTMVLSVLFFSFWFGSVIFLLLVKLLKSLNQIFPWSKKSGGQGERLNIVREKKSCCKIVHRVWSNFCKR